MKTKLKASQFVIEPGDAKQIEFTRHGKPAPAIYLQISNLAPHTVWVMVDDAECIFPLLAGSTQIFQNGEIEAQLVRIENREGSTLDWKGNLIEHTTAEVHIIASLRG